MSIPSEFQKKLSPEHKPFDSLKEKRSPNLNPSIGPGEDIRFDDHIYDATDDGIPANAALIEHISFNAEDDKLTKFLWVITRDGLLIIPEVTPNPDRVESLEKVVCHTNITGGDKAYIGGELWFTKDKGIIINGKSGRYGTSSKEKWKVAVSFFKKAGYKTIYDKSIL